jgi:hypothetical protein
VITVDFDGQNSPEVKFPGEELRNVGIMILFAPLHLHPAPAFLSVRDRPR